MNSDTPVDVVESVPPRAGRKEWIGLAVIALACILYSMDLTVLHLAIPQISRDLKPSSAELLWMIDIYGFVVAGSLITMGTLGDRIGRRRLLMIGAATFGVASVVAAFSNSAEMLIVTRAFLGLAGATLAPSTLSLIRSMFLDDRQRTTAIAIWITSFSAGAAIGPLLGGLVIEFFWWGAAFLLAVPMMALLLLLGPRLLPEYRDPEAGRVDIQSALLSLAAVLAMIFGLKQAAQNGFGWIPVASIAAGIALGAVFVRRQGRLANPLIDLQLFRSPKFTSALATYGLGILLVFGGFLFLPQYLQLVLGLSPIEAGLWTLPWALAFVVGSQLTPRLVRRIPASRVMGAGILLAAVGFGSLMRLGPSPNFALFVLGTVVFSLGLAPVFTLAVDMVVSGVRPEHAGAASGISETAAEFGGATGIAIFGTIGVVVYRGPLSSNLPSGLPSQVASAASNTLGGAVSVAGGLPAEIGNALLGAAREAFIRGLHISAAVALVGAIALAVFVLVALKDRGPVDVEGEVTCLPARC